jgi:gamma-tubulin complex component 4
VEGSEAGHAAGQTAGGGRTQQVHAALAPFSDDLASLRSARRLASSAEIDELVVKMAQVASRLLWRHLTHECGLADLLDALKGYFLLGRGELFHRLVLELRSPMASLPTARLDLQTALQHAAAGAEPDAGGYMKRLALVLPPAERDQSAYAAWRRLGLRMPVPFPLSLLVDARCVAAYSELFSFLFTVKRVQMELHGAWAAQMERARPDHQRAALLPVWRLRAHMAFLIDNLQYYLQVDVLDAQWQVLERAASEADDFEALAAAHEAGLAVLSARCFLQAGSVSSALHQIFQLCLSLCRMIEHADAGLRNPTAWEAQAQMIRAEFGRQTAFLLAFLSNVSSPQASPHLGQLLLRLNFNQDCGMLQAGALRA